MQAHRGMDRFAQLRVRRVAHIWLFFYQLKGLLRLFAEVSLLSWHSLDALLSCDAGSKILVQRLRS